MIRLRSRVSGSFSDHSRSNIFFLLERKLRYLEFPKFQICVWLWLSAQGFEHVRSLGRCHQRGRRKNGGADFVAIVRKDPEVRIAIQLRHCQSPIQRRAVSELRAFMLSNCIPTGLIVGNGRFQASAVQAAESYPGRPIELVSVRDLARSMVGKGLGVRKRREWLDLDDRFFSMLSWLRPAACTPLRVTKNRAVACALPMANEVVEVQIPSPNPPFKWLWYVVAALLIVAFFSTLWLARESL